MDIAKKLAAMTDRDFIAVAYNLSEVNRSGLFYAHIGRQTINDLYLAAGWVTKIGGDKYALTDAGRGAMDHYNAVTR